ncbi:translation initiation factor IF-2 [Arcticibacter tournemirensis]|uniref:Translation initiation factor IF-2 n=1 Tax=Arcticibacter tournemirensis TaxID=699437 RepID=A0A5M9HD10_9SPHI|nr:translation initiation factor IF-2 [Arcticibacter tournemirensis]KAA8484620.1 translation initiation factor IF-2 [Arcticibacter tournemirensis]TQM47092.1 translation initiation factor IF-2 [Arcticibacter tournemirensis]
MSEGKSINLLKAAKELNIGLSTAVESLGKKGFKVDPKPNTKLTEEMYNALLKEYQGDKIVREEARQIVIGKIRRDDTQPLATERQEPRRNKDFEQDEILIKNTGSFEHHQSTEKAKSVSAPADEPAEGNTEEKQEENALPGVKIVGKIDLDSLNRRPHTEPKTEKTEEDKPETAPEPEVQQSKEPVAVPVPAPEPTPVEAPVPVQEVKPEPEPEKQPEVLPEPEPQKPEPQQPEPEVPSLPEPSPEIPKVEEKPEVVEQPKEEQPEKVEEAVEDDVIRARAQRLTGPNVIGKIDLSATQPQRRKDQPVASSSNAANDHKRKRKRKDAGQPGHGQHGGGQQGQGGQHTQGGNPQQQGGQQRTGQGTPVPPPHQGPRPDFRGGARNQGARPDFRGGNRHHAGARHDNTPKEEPTEKEIQDQIKATLARLSGAGKSGKFAQRAKFRRQKRDDVAHSAEEAALEQELQSKVLKVTEFVTANELANMMDVPVTQIISTCMSLGMFVSINQRLDAETLTIVADEFGYNVEFVKPEDEEASLEEHDEPEDLIPRAPIVTVMGHVDHGKTSLLDFVRKTNVIAGEAGGITQHIGAYEVKLEDGRKITFLDTPGHEAFTAMRARGAKITDIAIIVIAADDSVMPQTREAINHAQAAGVPIVFAFSKVDKPGANADRIREQLSAMNILVEDWGGKYQSQEISGKTGMNVDLLLEKVLLEAELLELKANPNKRATGTVIEAALDKGRGIVTTVLIQAGTLHVGDPILAGSYSGRVKALTNERGQRVDKAGPSTPVQVLGMSGAPTAGDKFNAMESEPQAREIANKRLQLQREQGLRSQKHITLDEIGRRLAIGNFRELNIIVKGDVDGSIEALSDSLLKLSTEQIQVNIIHKSVGQISESDVLLASASDAIIIGFQVRPSGGARKLAEQEAIDIRLYSIIYDAINEVKAAMEGMLAPEFEEKIVANVEIRETFKISKVGTIAGCMVLDGKINRNSKVRIIRDGVVVYTGELASLKRYKDDVKEVSAGYECGLNINNFNNIEVGDIVEAYENVEVKRKL